MSQPRYPAGQPFTAFTVRPFWKVIPPWEKPTEGGVTLIVNPGAGYGTGDHPTTQLCLQAIGLLAPRTSDWRMLDFGSGSGILSVAAARRGALRVDAVEIDEEAITNSEENAALNGVTEQIRFFRDLEDAPGPYDLIVANILRPVLLDFARELARRLAPGGTLILSGLVGTDLPEVCVRYASVLKGRVPEIYQRGDWRALVWQKVS